MKMLYFLVTHLSLSTSLNKNFDWFDNRPFLKHHSSSSFMELTDVLSALLSQVVHICFHYSNQQRCVGNHNSHQGDHKGWQPSTPGIILTIRSLVVFLSSLVPLVAKVYKNFVSIRKKEPSRITNCVYLILYQIRNGERKIMKFPF